MAPRKLAVGGTCNKGHDLTEDNVRMEGTRVRCRTCTNKNADVPSKPKYKMEIGGTCIKGHLLDVGNIYVYPNGKVVCKWCRNMSLKKYLGKPVVDAPPGVWNRDKTHCPQGHEYDEENTRVLPSGDRKCRTCEYNTNRRHFYDKKYGITFEDYDKMLEAQSNACAICGKSENNNSKLHVDHYHNSNKVRGLLCNNCNNGLGRFLDSPEALRKAAEYVEKFM